MFVNSDNVIRNLTDKNNTLQGNVKNRKTQFQVNRVIEKPNDKRSIYREMYKQSLEERRHLNFKNGKEKKKLIWNLRLHVHV